MEIQKPSVIYEDSKEYFLDSTEVRQCQKVAKWNEMVVSALEIAESVNPYLADIPIGTVVRAVDALNWTGRNNDIRPKLFDKSTGRSRLLDSGPRFQ